MEIFKSIEAALEKIFGRVREVETKVEDALSKGREHEQAIADQAKQIVDLKDTVKNLTDQLGTALNTSFLEPIKQELDNIVRDDDTSKIEDSKPTAEPDATPAEHPAESIGVSDLPVGTQTDVVAAALVESHADEGAQQAGQTVEAVAQFDKSGRRV